MKFYISPNVADLLLAPSARGDIEGAILAGVLNVLIIGLGFIAYKHIKQNIKLKLLLSKARKSHYSTRKARV